MIHHCRNSSAWRGVASAAVAVLALGLGATASFAGECPADKRGVDLIVSGATMPEGVTDEVLAAIDLSKEAVKLDGRSFRLRQSCRPAGRRRPLAQPRRSPGAHLRRLRPDHRICQHLRGADRAQGRRGVDGVDRAVALVEEHR
jgi:hypothetical protein